MRIAFAPAAALAFALVALVACGDDPQVLDAPLPDALVALDGGPPDAVAIDAVPSTVVEVPCAGATIVSEVTAPGFSYAITQSTISVNDVVRFTMTPTHNAVSGPVTGGLPAPDGQFTADFNQTKCFRFTAAGTFPFYCSLHVFTGTITVVLPT